jgi:hypothetical protein
MALQKPHQQITDLGGMMFTSLNEKIIELARSLTKKVFSGDVTLLRGLLIIIFYVPFWLVFQIYSIMFFSDDLVDKIMRDKILNKDEDVVELIKMNRWIKEGPKRMKIFKAGRLLFSCLRVCGKWLKQVPVICLAVGLIQMMEYEATLDSVRNIDFKIIEKSIEDRDLSVKEDVVAIKSTINALTTYSGWALFPIAIVTPSGCFENGGTDRICKKYVTEKAFSDAVSKGDISRNYDVLMLSATDGSFYMFSDLQGGQGILIGQAGAYSSHLGRAAFLDKIPYYLWGSGFKKMYSKSRYIWLVISVAGFIFILTRQIVVKRNRRLWLKNRMSRFVKDAEAKKALLDLNEARLKTETMEADLEQQKTSTESLNQEYKEKLKHALAREKESEEAYFEILVSLEEQDVITKKLDAKLNSAQRKQALDETRSELSKIRKLWTRDYSWNERLEIERDITAQGNSPFIRNVSFVGFEMFIKKFARQKLNYGLSRLKAHDGPTVRDLIDELAEANMISEKDKNFFHEVRIARNNWMHEGKLPSEQLLKRLVNTLEKSNPVTRPVL